MQSSFFCITVVWKEADLILYKAAVVWNELLKFKYVFTYGYKQNLYTINLKFNIEQFSHLAGFQYAKDLQISRYNSQNIFRRILAGQITTVDIAKSEQYDQMIEPRLEVLANLDSILDNDFKIYAFNQTLCNFSTMLKADYFISSDYNTSSLVFMIKIDPSRSGIVDYVCLSVFRKGERDYEHNQKKLKVLKKEKVCLETGEVIVLEDKIHCCFCR